MHAFINALERSVGTYLYGRRMYETMAGWETDATLAAQSALMREFAEIWQAAEKIVYSRTIEAASTRRTRIERDFDPETVRRMKASAGRDLNVGGPDLAVHAFRAGLVDECHLFVAPDRAARRAVRWRSSKAALSGGSRHGYRQAGRISIVSVHPIAAAGFGASADAYERGRPGYPSAAIRWLARKIPLGAGVTVVDLAAGTGKLSRPLAATGARVIAIEPLEAMRRAIGPQIEALEGTAEAIPLPDAAADAVAVGQAFHWFKGNVALAEIHRVLRPNGLLALLWNTRRMEDAIHMRIEQLIRPHCERVPRHGTGAWREAFGRTELFGPLEETHFDHEQLVDAEQLRTRVASTSAIAALPEQERELVLEQVGALAGADPVRLRYRCDVHSARRIGP